VLPAVSFNDNEEHEQKERGQMIHKSKTAAAVMQVTDTAQPVTNDVSTTLQRQ